jgi:hypothetical protein
MPLDMPALVNQALTRLGPGAIFSVDDGSDLAKQVENSWGLTVNDAFSLHDWSWNRRTVKLARVVTMPDIGWRYGYMLPGDRIGPPLGFSEKPGCRIRNYAIEGNAVFCEAATLYGQFNRVVDPSEWPLDFLDAFVTLLCANLAVPVWQDQNLKAAYTEEAVGTPQEKRSGGKFSRVKARDMAGEPLGSPLMESDPLTGARNAGYPYDMNWFGRF